MKLIDKDAALAEIERLRALLPDANDCDCLQLEFARGQQDAYTDFEVFINTLEVKEVDLERLVNDYFMGWYFDRDLDILAKPNHYSATVGDVKEVAKHFFELGLRSPQTDDSYIEGVKGSYTTTDKD